MPNRIIKESICTSEEIDQLTPFQEIFFYRLMVNCDDFGRFDARPKILNARLFPLRSISEEEIIDAVNVLRAAGLITVYFVGGRPYLHMNTWERHQQKRATNSKYPSPESGTTVPDYSGFNQMISDDINGNQKNSKEIGCPRESRNDIREYDNRSRETRAMMDDDDAHEIQADHNRILDAAEDAGFKMSNDVRASLIDLYAKNGMEKMIEALKACVKHGATNLAYLEAVLKGKPRQAKPVVIAQDYEQRDYSGVQDELLAAQRREIEEKLRRKGAS